MYDIFVFQQLLHSTSWRRRWPRKQSWLRDIAKLSPHHQTSSLEAFHDVILRFAPKNLVYPFLGMLCRWDYLLWTFAHFLQLFSCLIFLFNVRLYLAALHYNENSDRGQATTSSGDLMFRLTFPKARKGECRAKPVKTEATFRKCQLFILLRK